MANSPIIYGGSNNLGLTLLRPSSAGAVTFDTSGNIGVTGIGTALGLATLDASGKIPSSELPSTVLQYQGLWNPVTNTPFLQDSTGTNGYVYQVSAAFAGPIVGLSNPTMVNFQVGNLIIYSGSISQWEQTTPAAGVQSVNGAQGNVTVNAINQLTGDVTAGPATGSQSEVSHLVATSNSTLTTLSALSLPYSQVTGTPTPLTFSDSLVQTGSTVTLVNDTATPTASTYYGTNASSVLGYYALPTSTGTVSSVSVVSANGFAGTVANPTTTPALTLSTTITGLLKGNGTAISAAVAGTDYVIPSGSITGTAANVTGVVAVANGGTGDSSLTPYALLAGGTTSAGAVQQVTALGSAGQGLISNGAGALPTFQTFTGATIVAPTVSTALANTTSITGGFGGVQQGWLFDITSSLSSTLTAGATYTNNGHTYTVVASLASGTSGQVLFMSGTAATSGTTLTFASGTGPATITISQTAPNAPLPTYLYTTPTSPRVPLYLEVEIVGGGSGGGGSGVTPTTSSPGLSTIFGTLLFNATGGLATSAFTTGAGGTINYSTAPWGGSSSSLVLKVFNGASGTQGANGAAGTTIMMGGAGGNSPLGGAGGGGSTGGAAANAINGTGSGGGGSFDTDDSSSPGGSSGAYAAFIINNPATTYLYSIGTGGAGGSAGGGSGGSGQINIKEFYQ